MGIGLLMWLVWWAIPRSCALWVLCIICQSSFLFSLPVAKKCELMGLRFTTSRLLLIHPSLSNPSCLRATKSPWQWPKLTEPPSILYVCCWGPRILRISSACPWRSHCRRLSHRLSGSSSAARCRIRPIILTYLDNMISTAFPCQHCSMHSIYSHRMPPKLSLLHSVHVSHRQHPTSLSVIIQANPTNHHVDSINM